MPCASRRAILHARLGVPLIATSRIHEPAEAEALLASGRGRRRRHDARADRRPRSAAPPVEGREDERILCTGCNQGCIGHYHLGMPISCLQNPRTGRERTLPGRRAAGRLARARDRRRARGHGCRRRRGARRSTTSTLVEAGAGAGRPVRARRARARAPRDGARATAPTGRGAWRRPASTSAWTRGRRRLGARDARPTA